MIHPEITDLQFRAMARERGYELRKYKEATHMLPCPICDTKRTRTWMTPHSDSESRWMYYRTCSKCGFEGNLAKTRELSKISWNEAVQACLKSKGQNLVDGGNDNVES